MYLAVDIGNTNTVFVVFGEGKKSDQIRLETRHNFTAEEYYCFLNMLLGNLKINISDIKGAIVSSVVPQTKHEMDKFFKRYLKITPVYISDILKNLKIKIKLKKPEELGADRIVNAYIAHKKYKKNAIVVDFGTATTFDVVSEKCEYLGGVIAPGVKLSLKALQDAAAKLPKIEIEKPTHIVGKNTVEAMQSGLYYGYLGMVEGVVSKLIKEFKTKPLVIATGGLAKFFGDSKFINKIEPDLTIDGLIQIFEEYCGKKNK